MSNAEKSGGGEGRKGRIFNFLKKFNKVSAAVLLSAGVIFDSEILLGLGLLDVGQAWLWGKAEKWRKQGKTAIGGAMPA